MLVRDHVQVPMRDGVRLSARIWLPDDASSTPVPAVLEYIPYRKGDATAARDGVTHPALAAAGYAGVRLDARGTGDSEGVMLGEYLQQELDDGVDAIAWLAEQRWCSGAVAMIGKSWGGFNGLQIAALRPPALRAVISICSTDDRFRDDIHMIGGCVYAAAALSWASTMFAYNARPPDPATSGESWRATWLTRLEAHRPWGHEWLTHQTRDAFWQHGSVCEDYDAIACPVYMVGGLVDPYRGAPFRLLAGAPGRTRALLGPWAHTYPHQGAPGPAIDFLGLCVRLLDLELKGIGTGLADEPALRAFMPEPLAAGPAPAVRTGRWVGEERWPPDREPLVLSITADGLRATAGPPVALSHDGSLEHGQGCPTYLPWGVPADEASDQQGEDGRCLTFDSEPLADRVEILGEARVRITRSTACTGGQLVVRLCDVQPGGHSRLIAYGVLDLHEATREVEVPLLATAHAFAAGNRIRVAVAGSYWPLVWPSPRGIAVNVVVGGSAHLALPTRPADGTTDLAPLDEPPTSAPSAVEQVEPAFVRRRAIRDAGSRELRNEVDASNFGTIRLGDGLTYRELGADRFSIREGDPGSAMASSRWQIELERGSWKVRIETTSTMATDAGGFVLDDEITVTEGGEQVLARSFRSRVPQRGTQL